VAAGLHHAHEKTDRAGTPLGIVHRDVSPSNVLVSFDGGVKVVDFGIAKAAAYGTRTRTGTTKGKVSCMSPEQCRGEAVDRRSDLFALGVLLYELTTGVRPFQGDSEYAIIRKIVDEDAAPPSRHRGDYPPRLEAIVLRALRRDPDQRYATAQELQVDLETFAQEQGWAVSSVELARFMSDLFGGHRPRRIDDVAESFLHEGLQEGVVTAAMIPPGPMSVPTPPPLSPAPSPASTRLRALLWGVAILFLAALSGSAYWLGGRHRAPVHAAQPPAVVPMSGPVVGPPPVGSERRPAPVLTRSPAEAQPGAPPRRHGRPTRKVDLDAPFPR
jgi:serine/threonine-protein kinase